MELDDAGVIVGRWEADAGIAAIRAIAEDVRRFASREGMATRASDDVVLAVAEAVADVVVDARHAGARRRLVAEAATDGIWLSVRITSEPGAGGRRPAGVLPLVTALADHVERGPRWAGSGDSVLMEFSMTRAGRLTSAASGPRVDAFVEDPRAAGLARARTRRADVRRARRR